MFRFVVCFLIVVSSPAFAEDSSLLDRIGTAETAQELTRVAERRAEDLGD